MTVDPPERWGDPTIALPVDPTETMPAPALPTPLAEPQDATHRPTPLATRTLAAIVAGAVLGGTLTWAATSRTRPGPEVVSTAGTVPDLPDVVPTTATPKASAAPAPTRGATTRRAPAKTVCR